MLGFGIGMHALGVGLAGWLSESLCIGSAVYFAVAPPFHSGLPPVGT